MALPYILWWRWGPSKLSHVPPQEETLGSQTCRSERDKWSSSKELEDEFTYLPRRTRGYLHHGWKQGWKCLFSDSWQHVKHLGMRLSRFLLHPVSLKSFRMRRGTWLTQKEQQGSQWLFLPLTSSSFLSEISKPAHLGGYGYWCFPGRY